MSVVRGAMGPQLEKNIKKQLEIEHKVIDEGIERTPVSVIKIMSATEKALRILLYLLLLIQIVDESLDAEEVVLEDEVVEEEPVEEQRPEPTRKECTVMVIKPDAVQAGKIDEIVERVRPFN